MTATSTPAGWKAARDEAEVLLVEATASSRRGRTRGPARAVALGEEDVERLAGMRAVPEVEPGGKRRAGAALSPGYHAR